MPSHVLSFDKFKWRFKFLPGWSVFISPGGMQMYSPGMELAAVCVSSAGQKRSASGQGFGVFCGIT